MTVNNLPYSGFHYKFSKLTNENKRKLDTWPILQQRSCFNSMISCLANHKKKGKYPSMENIMNPFKVTKFEDLKVIFLFDSPNHKNPYSGLPLVSNVNENGEITKDHDIRLSFMIDEIERTFYSPDLMNNMNSFDKIPNSELLHGDLQTWYAQGIMPVFLHPSLDEDRNILNGSKWRDFFKIFLKKVMKGKSIVLVTFGERTSDFVESTNFFSNEYVNQHNSILIKSTEPEFEGISKRSFVTRNLFKKIQEAVLENHDVFGAIDWIPLERCSDQERSSYFNYWKRKFENY